MYLSAKEAANKFCHRSMGLRDPNHCEVSDCMAWKWKTATIPGSCYSVKEIHATGNADQLDVGYCRDLIRPKE